MWNFTLMQISNYLTIHFHFHKYWYRYFGSELWYATSASVLLMPFNDFDLNRCINCTLCSPYWLIDRVCMQWLKHQRSMNRYILTWVKSLKYIVNKFKILGKSSGRESLPQRYSLQHHPPLILHISYHNNFKQRTEVCWGGERSGVEEGLTFCIALWFVPFFIDKFRGHRLVR